MSEQCLTNATPDRPCRDTGFSAVTHDDGHHRPHSQRTTLYTNKHQHLQQAHILVILTPCGTTPLPLLLCTGELASMLFSMHECTAMRSNPCQNVRCRLITALSVNNVSLCDGRSITQHAACFTALCQLFSSATHQSPALHSTLCQFLLAKLAKRPKLAMLTVRDLHWVLTTQKLLVDVHSSLTVSKSMIAQSASSVRTKSMKQQTMRCHLCFWPTGRAHARQLLLQCLIQAAHVVAAARAAAACPWHSSCCRFCQQLRLQRSALMVQLHQRCFQAVQLGI